MAKEQGAKEKTAEGRDWSETLFLPKTDFAMKAGLPERLAPLRRVVGMRDPPHGPLGGAYTLFLRAGYVPVPSPSHGTGILVVVFREVPCSGAGEHHAALSAHRSNPVRPQTPSRELSGLYWGMGIVIRSI